MSVASILETNRLILIASPREWIKISISAPERFSELVDGHLPIDWPSESLRQSAGYVLMDMSEEASEIGWWIWWALEKTPTNENGSPQIVGNIGFKGPPKQAGIIELSYALVISARGRGLVTEGVG